MKRPGRQRPLPNTPNTHKETEMQKHHTWELKRPWPIHLHNTTRPGWATKEGAHGWEVQVRHHKLLSLVTVCKTTRTFGFAHSCHAFRWFQRSWASKVIRELRLFLISFGTLLIALHHQLENQASESWGAIAFRPNLWKISVHTCWMNTHEMSVLDCFNYNLTTLI